MFTYFMRILFSPLSLSLGPTFSAIPGDTDGNGTNVDEIIAAIAQDKRIDGSDDVLVNHLLDKLEVSNTEISDATRLKISVDIQNELELSLELGYTVLDERSYNTYKRLMGFLHSDIQIPPYKDIKTTIFNSGAFESTYSFVYNKEDKSIGIYRHDIHSSSGNIFAVIQNGKVQKALNLLNWDTFSNNNQFGLSEDIIDIAIPKPEVPVIQVQPEAPVAPVEPEEPLVPVEPEPEEIPLVRPRPRPERPHTPTPTPEAPVAPVEPEEPIVPVEPEPEEIPSVRPRPRPERPHTPTPTPEEPVAPVEPEEPVVPVEPESEIPLVRPRPRPEVEKPEEYIVRRGDVLWRIVRDHYGLTDNKVIADTVNWVVEQQIDARLQTQLRKDVYGGGKTNTADGVMGDILFPGDIIILPPLKNSGEE